MSSSAVTQLPDRTVAAYASSLTEALEGTTWWVSNEGGVMSRDGHITGIRSDGDGYGDYLGENVVITRLSSDQQSSFDRRVEMARQTNIARYPIGVVVRHDHLGLVAMGIDMTGERWAVMGFYLLTDFWVKWCDGIKYIMVKLEKISSPSTSDWIPSDFDELAACCATCKEPLVSRYQGCPPICGTPRCATNATPSGDNSQPTGDYNKEWLDTRHNLFIPPFSTSLLPNLPQFMNKQELVALHNVCTSRIERINWNGWFCVRCLRLNQRVYWNRLECRKCGNSVPYGMPDFGLEELVPPGWRDITIDSAIPGLKFNDHITHTVNDSHPGYVVHTFRLDDENSVIIGFPTELAVTYKEGSKSVFEKLWARVQEGTIPLQRCPVRAKIPGQLTRFFATNYGEEYLAKMATDTTSFEEAPDVIRCIKNELTSVVWEILGGEDPKFNELLCIGNYPNMAMNWHKDGEKGVGPVVASFSYGGTAIMSFAMDRRHLVGRGRKNGAYLYETILPGCLKEEKKRSLMKKRDEGRITNEKYREKFRDVVDKITMPSANKPILQFPLPGTGTLMIQVGKSLNQRFEHKVEHNGIARLVTTCRTIEHDEHQA
ncbi:hypothetical protein PG993_011207 [Apiospora rasikravindrae]|uniref:Alpha-ketoglutarate-dependent dioxygenase AlkB-like domain-containing protein n=1 Tax=Apiospora rasikravindrae TaxID=990691 RepID=A0ABR1SDL2_9PEZI